jgi:hypothetical protein
MIAQIIIFVCSMIIWSLIRIRSMLSMQKNREAAVFGSILGVSSIVGSLLIARVNVPDMIVPFKIMLEPFGKMLLMQ